MQQKTRNQRLQVNCLESRFAEEAMGDLTDTSWSSQQCALQQQEPTAYQFALAGALPAGWGTWAFHFHKAISGVAWSFLLPRTRVTDIDILEQAQEKAHQDDWGLGHLIQEERLGELGLFSLKKRLGRQKQCRSYCCLQLPQRQRNQNHTAQRYTATAQEAENMMEHGIFHQKGGQTLECVTQSNSRLSIQTWLDLSSLIWLNLLWTVLNTIFSRDLTQP